MLLCYSATLLLLYRCRGWVRHLTKATVATVSKLDSHVGGEIYVHLRRRLHKPPPCLNKDTRVESTTRSRLPRVGGTRVQVFSEVQRGL